MMQKEILNVEVMEEFVAGFRDEGWKETGKGLCLLSVDGNSMFTYEDLGEDEETAGDKKLILWRENDPYILQQSTTETVIEYHFIVPPYEHKYFNPRDNNCGVVYGPDGCMVKNERSVGLPERIDMDKTVELFLKQVAEKDFSVPVLVKMG